MVLAANGQSLTLLRRLGLGVAALGHRCPSRPRARLDDDPVLALRLDSSAGLVPRPPPSRSAGLHAVGAGVCGSTTTTRRPTLDTPVRAPFEPATTGDRWHLRIYRTPVGVASQDPDGATRSPFDLPCLPSADVAAPEGSTTCQGCGVVGSNPIARSRFPNIVLVLRFSWAG
jgi:hypothetical protein